jgi:hypothetical protein
MASILKVDALQGITAAGDITVTSEGGTATQSLQQGLAKSWVNFNGTGTVAIRDSLNTSAISDRGTGQYTVNNSASFNNTNFAFMTTAGHDNASGTACNFDPWEFTTSATKANSFQETGSTTVRNDRNFLFASFLGDLA